MKPTTMTYAAPIGVGALMALYAVALLLMSGGSANPALVLLFLVLGAACVAYGLYRRSSTAS